MMAFIKRVRSFNFFLVIIGIQGKVTEKVTGWKKADIEIYNLKNIA